MTNKVERGETDPANPAYPAPGRGLHWPKIMPSWCYRDPALQGDGKGDGVPRETIAAVHASAPIHRHDRYYTQAKRLHIRNLMKGRT